MFTFTSCCLNNKNINITVLIKNSGEKQLLRLVALPSIPYDLGYANIFVLIDRKNNEFLLTV